MDTRALVAANNRLGQTLYARLAVYSGLFFLLEHFTGAVLLHGRLF